MPVIEAARATHATLDTASVPRAIWWEIEVWDGHVDPWTRAERRNGAGLAAH